MRCLKTCLAVVTVVGVWVGAVAPAAADITYFSSGTGGEAEAAWQAAIGPDRHLAGFEGIANGTVVTNQYSGEGATFDSFHDYWGNPGTPKVAVFDSSSVYRHSGTGSMYSSGVPHGSGRGWAVDFVTPVQGVGFWSRKVLIADYPNAWVELRDSGGTSLGRFNLGTTGAGHGELGPWGFNGYLSSAANIARMEVSLDVQSYFHDDFQWGTAIPAPSAGLLVLAGLTSFAWLRRRTQ